MQTHGNLSKEERRALKKGDIIHAKHRSIERDFVVDRVTKANVICECGTKFPITAFVDHFQSEALRFKAVGVTRKEELMDAGEVKEMTWAEAINYLYGVDDGEV